VNLWQTKCAAFPLPSFYKQNALPTHRQKLILYKQFKKSESKKQKQLGALNQETLMNVGFPLCVTIGSYLTYFHSYRGWAKHYIFFQLL
jgi:hypothetical protein